jgi:hypothetical protein
LKRALATHLNILDLSLWWRIFEVIEKDSTSKQEGDTDVGDTYLHLGSEGTGSHQAEG